MASLAHGHRTTRRGAVPPRRRWREVHRWCWLACWTPLGVLCVVLGLTMARTSDVVALGISGALCGAVVVGMARGDGAPRRGAAVLGVLARHREGPAAVVCGLAAAGVDASSALLGPATWPLVLLAVLTSPAAAAGLTRCLRGPSSRRPRVRCTCGCRAPVGAEQLAGVVHVLSDPALRRAWRRSADRLTSARSATELAEIAVVRQVYLDELERRFPEAMLAWLASTRLGTRADVGAWPPDTSASDPRA